MKQFAVFGLGRFGYTVALSLTREGAEVIAVDSDMRLVEQIKPFKPQFHLAQAVTPARSYLKLVAGISSVSPVIRVVW